MKAPTLIGPAIRTTIGSEFIFTHAQHTPQKNPRDSKSVVFISSFCAMILSIRPSPHAFWVLF